MLAQTLVTGIKSRVFVCRQTPTYKSFLLYCSGCLLSALVAHLAAYINFATGGVPITYWILALNADAGQHVSREEFENVKEELKEELEAVKEESREDLERMRRELKSWQNTTVYILKKYLLDDPG